MNDGLVKGIKFKKHQYIGDPINSIRIFNDKGADELIYLDIDCSIKSKKPDFNYIKKITDECFMPLCYGGGVQSKEEVLQILGLGVEKVAINTGYVLNKNLITESSKLTGSQSIVAVIDYKKSLFGKNKITILNGTESIKQNPIDLAKMLEEQGAGEILLNSIDRDGTRSGYDIDMIHQISSSISIPVVALGGSNSIEDFKSAKKAGASAAAAGSQFVFYGQQNAVLINYPITEEIREKEFFDN
tara:strand:+ start:1260 stop:1991 length:732 start_codon:yes stop_codon:yes gene_type:complete